MDQCRCCRHQSLTAATARAKRLLAVTCLTMFLPFRDRPQTWVRPRKSKLVPSVSGWRAPSVICGRKSTRRVLSGWSVSPNRARRFPRTASTRLASTILSNAMIAVGEPGKGAFPFEARPHLGLEPFVQHIVQEDVREARRDHAPLRGTLGRAAQETVFDGPRLQPFVDHPSDDAVRHSLVEERSEMRMRNRNTCVCRCRSPNKVAWPRVRSAKCGAPGEPSGPGGSHTSRVRSPVRRPPPASSSRRVLLLLTNIRSGFKRRGI